MPQEAKGGKSDPIYKYEHNELFRDHGMAWPPTLSKDEEQVYDFTAMDDRMKETTIFLNRMFPPNMDSVIASTTTPYREFVDVGQSIQRLCQKKSAGLLNPMESEDADHHWPMWHHRPDYFDAARRPGRDQVEVDSWH